MTQRSRTVISFLFILSILVIGTGFLPSTFDKTPPPLNKHDDVVMSFPSGGKYTLTKSKEIIFEDVVIVQQDVSTVWLEVTYHYTPLNTPEELFIGARQIVDETLGFWMAYRPSEAISPGTGKALVRLGIYDKAETKTYHPHANRILISAYKGGSGPEHETLFGDYPRHWCKSADSAWHFTSPCRESLLKYILSPIHN